jgi:hypothetical protein
MKKENSISKRKLRSSYLTSIISISLVLFLLGLVGLLALNANRLAVHVKENIGFSVILKEGAREVDIIRLQKNLDAKVYVKSTDYISKRRTWMQRFMSNQPIISARKRRHSRHRRHWERTSLNSWVTIPSPLPST